jgi:hypothetical protein
MLHLSKKWHEQEGLPVWIFLQALVEMLAVYGAGPKYDPEEFAPLLGALIRSETQDVFAEFQIEDLGELVDIDARVFELEDDEVVSFANKVHQLKFSGDDNTGSIQLQIKRTFQSRRLADNTEAEKARSQVREGEKKLEIAREIAISTLAKEIKPRIARKRLIKSYGAQLVIGLILLFLTYKHWNDRDSVWLSVYVIALMVDVASPFLNNLFSGGSALGLEEEVKKEAVKIWEENQDILGLS